MSKTKVEKLKKELEALKLEKDQKHEAHNNIFYDIIDKKLVKEKDVFYMLSKIEWQGKEALGVMRINELMQRALQKDPKAKDKDVLKMRPTEMNALLYLLLRVKSNSRSDAEIYTNSIYPIVHQLEDKVSEVKVKYDSEMKPIVNKIEKLEKELDELIIATDEKAMEVINEK